MYLGQLEPLNDFLQMAPFPSAQFQAHLVVLLMVNFGICYAIENACRGFEYKQQNIL